MKFVIQRVNKASVEVDGQLIGSIGHGLLVFIGVGNEDNEIIADAMIRKLLQLRIFMDENGKTNLDTKSVDGSLLLISQFTLYADCKKGNRPSFINAGAPEQAKQLYEYIIDKCQKEISNVQTGEFGADMKVSLENDGPFTIVLDSNELTIR